MIDLLKRIDEEFFFVVDADGQQRLDRLLADCRAEIERLTKVLEVTDENHGRTTVLAHKALKDLDIANAEIERLRTYTPMTDDEWCEVSNAFEYDGNPLSEENEWKRERHIEQAVVKRIMGND